MPREKLRKPLPRKKPPPKKDVEFDWYKKEIGRFLDESGACEIITVNDPNIYLVDHFLKLTMDGMRKYMADALERTGLSPMEILWAVIQDSYEHLWARRLDSVTPKHTIPLDFMRVCLVRVAEDMKYRRVLRSPGAYTSDQKNVARSQLKQRGLL